MNSNKKFSIRKLSFGVASMVIGSAIFIGATNEASAAEVESTTTQNAKEVNLQKKLHNSFSSLEALKSDKEKLNTYLKDTNVDKATIDKINNNFERLSSKDIYAILLQDFVNKSEKINNH
ncbi:TPA: YSIRK-type signal peptide-containing protein [Staphylococcus aureus]|nr:YSIRK-type signal peptide-containing protein [Staphylococcus aureus]